MVRLTIKTSFKKIKFLYFFKTCFNFNITVKKKVYI